MKRQCLIYADSKISLVSKLFVAQSFWERTIGLLNRSGLGSGEGFLIKPCSGVHTIGMRFSIDVMFLGRDMTVLRCVQSLKPWRMAGPVLKAKCVVELPEGALESSKVKIGDRFEIISGTE